MPSRREDNNDRKTVQLLRGGRIVSSLVGAFGGDLRETRLTTLLGYLMAIVPESFGPEFGISGTIRSVSLEMSHSGDRSDIHVETTAGTGIIEAKVV